MICHGCEGTGKVRAARAVADTECTVCGGTGSLPDTYSVEIARTRPDLCPACGRSRSEPALSGCPKNNHYVDFGGVSSPN